MKYNLFRGDIPPACGYCRLGRPVSGGKSVLCERYGVVSASFSCKKYIYDPLKRIPKKMPPLPAFTEQDFEL